MSIKKTLSDMKKVWKVTKKPSKKDYMLTLKIVAIGFLILGIIGFTVELIWIGVLNRFFGG